MAKQAMLYESPTCLLIFWLEVANKKPICLKSLLLDEFKFPVKKIKFFTVTKFCTPGCYTRENAVC